MNVRPQAVNNSLAIRQEIQRFESVHPSIYAIYDLIEVIPDPLLVQQIREHVVSIEDSFVNSQEWTISRSVPDIRLGIVGSLASGKSALVHRYLTGSYMQEESPEGGRFKKEVMLDGQSYLLLIRDEGGAPEIQFTSWVDAVIFVFSLENEASFNAVYAYYNKMMHYRHGTEVPLILVGTQDGISETNPRVIDDARARKLAADLKRCSYYETCATYGLNVDRVFQDACQKIVQQRANPLINSRPSTPSHNLMNNPAATSSGPTLRYYPASYTSISQATNNNSTGTPQHNSGGLANQQVLRSPLHVAHNNRENGKTDMQPPLTPHLPSRPDPPLRHQSHSFSTATHHYAAKQSLTTQEKYHLFQESSRTPVHQHLVASSRDMTSSGNAMSAREGTPLGLTSSGKEGSTPMQNTVQNLIESLSNSLSQAGKGAVEFATPTSTPTTSRKNRRRSNLFTPSKKSEEEKKLKNGEVGSGRAIPLKQGYLYKKSCKTLNKDWKKKYVTLCDDGKLTYHPSLHDYMEDAHGKEISLMHTTVKVPGRKPRGSQTKIVQNSSTTSVNGVANDLHSLSIAGSFHSAYPGNPSEKYMLTGYELLRDASRTSNYSSQLDDGSVVIPNSQLMANGTAAENALLLSGSSGMLSKAELTPNVKKRHKRMKSSGVKNMDNMDDSDGYEFMIVSLDNKQWHFEASNGEEREQWMRAIEQQILNSLQSNESCKSSRNSGTQASVEAIRNSVDGNLRCVDCDAPNPDWASINLGALVCIECCGIHRNLGSHISRVRSLNLDDWPPGPLNVMQGIGNQYCNQIWEANAAPRSSSGNRTKPNPNSPRDDKERWIRLKYEAKEFIAPLPTAQSVPQQLIEATCDSNVKKVFHLLAHATADNVNTTLNIRDSRTPLHLASALGNIAITQLLIWHGANVNAVNNDGRTALAMARGAQAPQELCDLLVQSGCEGEYVTSQVPANMPSSTTLPRRKPAVAVRCGAGKADIDKLPASII